MAKFGNIRWRTLTSRWVEASKYAEGDLVIGPMGATKVLAVGDSPLGAVYRVESQGGGSYDLLEHQIVGKAAPDRRGIPAVVSQWRECRWTPPAR